MTHYGSFLSKCTISKLKKPQTTKKTFLRLSSRNNLNQNIYLTVESSDKQDLDIFITQNMAVNEVMPCFESLKQSRNQEDHEA